MRTLRILAALVAAAGATCAQGLEERVRALEEGLESREAPPVRAWYDDGLHAGDEDAGWEVVLGGYLIARGDFFLRHRERDQVDTFAVEDASIHVLASVDGAWEGYVHGSFQPDGAQLYLAHAGFVLWDEFQVRAGVITAPFSMEFDEWVQWIDLPAYSLTSVLDPDIALGVLASGRVAEGAADWAVGVFNGNGPGQDADENGDKDVVARVRGRLEETPLGFLHAGLAASVGRARKEPGATPFDFAAPATGTTWHSDPGAVAFRTDGRLWRAQGQIAWIAGPFELRGEAEILRAQVDFPGSRNHPFRAWSAYATAGFWIGGSRRPAEEPEVESPLFDGGFGALQFTGRVSRTVLDDAFAHHAAFEGARRALELALGVNWYPNRRVRLSAMFAQVEYASGRAILDGGTRARRENVLAFRAQLDF